MHQLIDTIEDGVAVSRCGRCSFAAIYRGDEIELYGSLGERLTRIPDCVASFAGAFIDGTTVEREGDNLSG